MNIKFITVKNLLTAIREARPVSHAAAVTLLGTSIYAVHEGAAATLPSGLVVATTAAMLGAEWLQWTSLGRLATLEAARDDDRARVLRWQAVGIGLLQVSLYTLAVQNFAREAGQDWSQGWALALAVGFAALFAALNFVAKWTSCDHVAPRTSGRPPVRANVQPIALESEPADWGQDSTVIAFADRLAHRARIDAVEADRLRLAPPERSTSERLTLATKRLQTRARRAAKRAA